MKRSKSVHILSAALLFGAAAGLAGCSSAAKSSDASATTSAAAPGSASASAASGSTSSGAASAAATPGDALVGWVTDILETHYQQACLAAAPAIAPGQDPQKVCSGQQISQFDSVAKSLHEAWAKPGITLPPGGRVEATAAASSAGGSSVTIPDTAITVDGHTLHALELIGSSGDTSAFSMTFDVKKIDGAWYVYDWNINA
jgi:hypothetical protein